jgi:hypothetical protein
LSVPLDKTRVCRGGEHSLIPGSGA